MTLSRSLAPLHDLVRHRFSFALRPVDHFLGQVIAENLVFAVVGSDARPILAPGRTGTRHRDGTYRFADLSDGTYDVVVSSPSGRWMSLAGPISVAVPAAAQAIDVELWPTPRSRPFAGFTGFRGTLVGSGVAGLQVEFGEPPGEPPPDPPSEHFTGHFTVADGAGEFVTVIAPAIQADDVGLVTLRVRVAGGGRSVTTVTVDGGAPIAGADFQVPAGRELRIVIEVGP